MSEKDYKQIHISKKVYNKLDMVSPEGEPWDKILERLLELNSKNIASSEFADDYR